MHELRDELDRLSREVTAARDAALESSVACDQVRTDVSALRRMMEGDIDRPGLRIRVDRLEQAATPGLAVRMDRLEEAHRRQDRLTWAAASAAIVAAAGAAAAWFRGHFGGPP